MAVTLSMAIKIIKGEIPVSKNDKAIIIDALESCKKEHSLLKRVLREIEELSPQEESYISLQQDYFKLDEAISLI